MAGAIGIFGGSFDPVHNGHVVVAILAVERLGLERLLVVPAHRSPHKDHGAAGTPQARLELLRLAFEGLPAVEVSTIEIDRPPPSYTIDTIQEMARRHAGRELVLLLGTDAVADFPKWRDVSAIVERCRLAVFPRAGVRDDAVEAAAASLPGLRVTMLDTPVVDISATLVRERAGAGLPLRGFVPDAVATAIAARRLYARG